MYKKHSYFLSLLSLLALLILPFSCQKELESPEVKLKPITYYPVETGIENVYQITRIHIDAEVNVFDTVEWLLKETIGEVLDSTSEYKRYQLNRFINTATGQWEKIQEWQLLKYDNCINRVEDNIEIITLSNPIKEGTQWDRNLYNTSEPAFSTIKEIEPLKEDSLGRNSLRVVWEEDENLIKKVFKEERYINHLGLYEITSIDVELNIDPDVDWTEKIQKGDIFYQKRINILN